MAGAYSRLCRMHAHASAANRACAELSFREPPALRPAAHAAHECPCALLAAGCAAACHSTHPPRRARLPAIPPLLLLLLLSPSAPTQPAGCSRARRSCCSNCGGWSTPAPSRPCTPASRPKWAPLGCTMELRIRPPAPAIWQPMRRPLRRCRGWSRASWLAWQVCWVPWVDPPLGGWVAGLLPSGLGGSAHVMHILCVAGRPKAQG